MKIEIDEAVLQLATVRAKLNEMSIDSMVQAALMIELVIEGMPPEDRKIVQDLLMEHSGYNEENKNRQ